MTIDIKQTLDWASKETNSIFSDEVTYLDNNSDTLVIAAGDSWTYGDSLDDRLNEMYGFVIADNLNTDLLNIGFRGFANSFILNFTNEILQNNLENLKNYNNIYLIVTLTENARDVRANHSFDFDYIQHYKETDSDFYSSVLERMEDSWVRWLEKISEYTCLTKIIVGQNFIWHKNIIDKLDSKFIKTSKNWIEVIAENANYESPQRTNLVTGWIFDEFKEVNDIAEIKDDFNFKEFVLPYIEKANDVNRWLDESEYNGEKASKHPNKIGHLWWAEYLIKYIKNNE